MRAKAVSRSLLMAFCLFECGFARSCRPRPASSELASTVTTESTTATSTDSTDISATSTDTPSASTILTSASSIIDTASASTTENASISPPESSATDPTATITNESASTALTSTAEDTSTDTPQATSTTDSTATSSLEAASTADPNPIISTFYMKSVSQSASNNGLPMQFWMSLLTRSNVYLTPPSSLAASYSPSQLHLEEGTNKLMMNEYYLIVATNNEVLTAPSDGVPNNAEYITCTPPVRDGLSLQCVGDGYTDFVVQGNSLLMVYSFSSSFLPRVSFIGTSSA